MPFLTYTHPLPAFAFLTLFTFFEATANIRNTLFKKGISDIILSL
jgi:hypothetical protein